MSDQPNKNDPPPAVRSRRRWRKKNPPKMPRGSSPEAQSSGEGIRPLDPAPADRARVVQALEHARDASRGLAVGAPKLLVRREDLSGLSAEDLRPALDEMIVQKHADAGLDSLLVSGLLETLLPEVQAMVGFGDGEWRHKDVWKHTKQVVIQAVPRLQVRWSALFHDIGKVKTRTISDSGEVHFFGHAEVGARMFDRLERRARLFSGDEALQKEIRFLVLHHLRASGYEGNWTDSAVRRFAREMGPYLDDLLCLSRADITTKRPEKKRRGIRQIHELSDRVSELAAVDSQVPPLPKGVGEYLMREFQLPPSKLIGDIKRALEAACDAGEIASGEKSEYYVQVVAKDRNRFGLSSD